MHKSIYILISVHFSFNLPYILMGMLFATYKTDKNHAIPCNDFPAVFL